MKRIIAIIFCILTVFSLTSCNKADNTNSTAQSTVQTPNQNEEPKPHKEYPYEAEYTELGIPLSGYYTDGGIERCVWDIEYYDGGIYVGSGDYDKNKGPIYMTHYSLKEEKWKVDTGLPDEQIERMFVFDNRLYAAGCDPKTSWSYGNFYYLLNGRWQVNNTIPGGIHNFDMIKFNGKLYAGLGVVEGDAPVQVTEDEKNWTPVYLYKDGELRKTNGAEYIRVYDFFVLDGELYAYFFTYYENQSYNEIYRLEGDRFVYHSDMITTLKAAKCMYTLINQKVEFKGTQYFATGYFYKSEDMKTAERINVGDKTAVTDIRVINDTLYILCNERIIAEDETEYFRVSVKMSEDGAEFKEMFSFNYPVRALSFTYAEDHFYFGMGYGIRAQKNYDENGTVLAVENPL